MIATVSRPFVWRAGSVDPVESAVLHSSVRRLPPSINLYTNVNQLPTVNCPGRHPNSPRAVKATFHSALYWAPSRIQAPAAGWKYITAEETAIRSIPRCYVWFEEAMDKTTARELELHTDSVSLEDEGNETDAEEAETKGITTPRIGLAAYVRRHPDILHLASPDLFGAYATVVTKVQDYRCKMGIDVAAADWLKQFSIHKELANGGPVGSDKRRDQVGALCHHAGPNDVQEEVSQGGNLSRDGRFAAAAGPVGEGCSLANMLFLRRRFFTTMMEEGDDALEHINKIKTLTEQLDAVGAPVSEDDLVITLLASLSESYQFLITVLESRADSLTWELVTARLLNEDLKRKEQGGGVEGTAHDQAFMTSGNGKSKGRQAQKTSACHYCGEQGHWIAQCPASIRENAERQSHSERM
ncbi:hypothetical protein ON010_g14640 [Phytophthora cinnamomi]|nr:hypothetical protein ON010_g14640 [Phytophthora cinnamomi]